MRTFTLTIRPDDDMLHLDPNEEGGPWKLVSFSTRHRGHENPSRYVQRDGEGVDLGMRRKLKAGTMFVLSCYQHSATVWSLRGEGPQCRWDTAPVAGVLVCANPSELPKSYEAREKSARAFVSYFTAWANGWGWGYELTVLEPRATDDGCSGDAEEQRPVSEDSCWGFVGQDQAEAGVLDSAADALLGYSFDEDAGDKLVLVGLDRADLDAALGRCRAWRAEQAQRQAARAQLQPGM